MEKQNLFSAARLSLKRREGFKLKDSLFKGLNFKFVSHGLETVPDLVVVQVVMSNGYISEAGGIRQ